MDFLVLSSAAVGAGEPDDELTERHWSYMDRFADGMTARGPTLSPDRSTWTGSMHVVALSSVRALRSFVAEEPYEVAGRFASHRTWSFTNLLGRTMWEHRGQADLPTFLVLSPAPVDLPDEQLLMCGALATEDGAPAGFAAAVIVDHGGLLDHSAGEIHPWERGGRR